MCGRTAGARQFYPTGGRRRLSGQPWRQSSWRGRESAGLLLLGLGEELVRFREVALKIPVPLDFRISLRIELGSRLIHQVRNVRTEPCVDFRRILARR